MEVADPLRASASFGRDGDDPRSLGCMHKRNAWGENTSLISPHLDSILLLGLRRARCVVVEPRTRAHPPHFGDPRSARAGAPGRDDKGRSAHRYSWRRGARACSSGRARCRVKLVPVVKYSEKTGKPEKALWQWDLCRPSHRQLQAPRN